MFYVIIVLAVIITILRFVYLKTKSILFIRSFQLIEDTLYKDKLPYTGTIKVRQIDSSLYLDFNDGNLQGLTLNMKDGASVYWRVPNKYLTCYGKDGRQITQARFEVLYARSVDVNSMLSAYNERFTHAQLAV